MLHPQEIKLIDSKGYPTKEYEVLLAEADKLSIYHKQALTEQLTRQFNAIGL